MFLASKIVRHMVFGLMFVLAMAAGCSCDSYDPDPYDDMPPVVSVEFNYVVPSKVSIRLPGAQARNRQQSRQMLGTAGLAASTGLFLLEPFFAPAFGKGHPQIIIPLRR
jgi:hypothetical protein